MNAGMIAAIRITIQQIEQIFMFVFIDSIKGESHNTVNATLQLKKNHPAYQLKYN